MKLSLPMSARDLHDRAQLPPAVLERLSEAAFIQFNALHLPKRRYSDLYDFEKEKYRLMVLAVHLAAEQPQTVRRRAA